MQHSILCFLIGICFSLVAWAAPHAPEVSEALGLPQKNRYKILKQQGLSELSEVARDEDQSLQIRWRAVTAMGALFGKRAIKELEGFAKSPLWFLRNAAIISMVHTDRRTALHWSEKLLDDPALMVRTSAVQTIKRLKGHELQNLLWKKIYSPINFHRGQSLWVRKHIAEFLADYAYLGQEDKFLKLLLDPDVSLHPAAMRGLKKITGLKLTNRDEWLQRFAKTTN